MIPPDLMSSILTSALRPCLDIRMRALASHCLDGVVLKQVGVVFDGACLFQPLDFSFGYDGFLRDGKVFEDSDRTGSGFVEVAFELWGGLLLCHAAHEADRNHDFVVLLHLVLYVEVDVPLQKPWFKLGSISIPEIWFGDLAGGSAGWADSVRGVH
jgi:hypothetical protein